MRKFLTLVDRIVPMHHPRVLVDTALAQGATMKDLLRGLEIVPEMFSNPEARISYVQFGRLVGNALRATRNPALGLDVGCRAQLSHLGVLGLAIMSSPTGRSALEVGLRYYRSLSPAWDLSLEVEQHKARLVVREALPLGPYRMFGTEALLAAIWSHCRFLLGDAVTVLEICLPYEAPAHVARYHALFGVQPRFESTHVEVEFDAALLELPLSYADPVTAALAERHCTEQLDITPTVEGLIGQVRSLLNAEPGKYADLEALARKLQTSTRSLRRSLQQMGTSYQRILDDVRREQALRCVVATQMTSEQMAGRLGFCDVRSFRRAFKRWTGHTPQSYRAAMKRGIEESTS